MTPATITIGIDPTIELGPLELAWHGIMIAVGIAVGIPIAQRHTARYGRDPAVVVALVVVVVIAGMVGARLLYLIEHPADLAAPGRWLGTNGYSIYGALIAAPAAAALWLRHRGLSAGHLDSLAFAFPAAMAVGRLGDVINGEHYGPVTGAPWGIRYSHPEALTPTHDVAYHPGGLYEVVLALAMLAALWPLRRRLERPGQMLWAVVGLYALGRLVMFTWRSDSPDAVLGLSSSQLVSLLLLAAAAVGLAHASRRPAAAESLPAFADQRSQKSRP